MESFIHHKEVEDFCSRSCPYSFVCVDMFHDGRIISMLNVYCKYGPGKAGMINNLLMKAHIFALRVRESALF